MSALSSVLLVLPAVLAVMGGRLLAASAGRRVPVATLCMAIAVGAGLLLQLAWPPALAMFRRDADAIATGELWRLGTALFFQDGGLAGGLFNLTLLALIGTAAEQVWRPLLWLVVYFGGGLLTEIAALWWQPVGAGNSVACFALAGSLFALAVTARGRGPLRLLGGAGFAAAVVLMARQDIHGIAIAIGGAAGLIASWPRGEPAFRPSRPGSDRTAD